MSQRNESLMEEMRELLDRISDSGIEVPQPVREAMCGLHLDQFTTYDFDGFFHDRPVVFMETENGGVKTISAPHMIVTLLHHLELNEGHEVLVVGSKGGYIAALIAKPDRTSARTLKLTPQNHESVLTERQLKLAKYAYDRGYYDLPKRIKITELAEQLGLARATISEHLTKIEGILMDDMFSSMTDVRLTVEQARTIVETMESDMDEEETYQTESFAGLIKRIKENIAEELPSDTENVPELDIRQDPEEILKRIQEDIP